MQLLPADLKNPDEDQERIKEVAATLATSHVTLCPNRKPPLILLL